MTRVILLVFALAGPATAAEWEPTATELLKAEKTGFGGLCGVAVDHATGDVLIDLSDRGLFRSADRGKTWAKHGPVVKGRTEWPGCLLFDPTGKSKRLVMALVYGAPVGISADAGATSAQLDAKSQHVDWAVVDWAEMKFVLALKHESGGLLLASHDGGKTFAELGKGFGPAWVFDGQKAVAAEAKSKDRSKPRLMRTADGGKTWDPVGEYTATALPKWHDGMLYWLVDGALLSTADQGKTWAKVSDVKDGAYGPVFGRDSKHLFVLTKGGVLESTDGGAAWGKPIALPKELKGTSPLTWLEYDPTGDVLYVMKMGSDLYRLARK
jgi:photosystem II stability/assembly factor-like uncharacterized protein